MQFQHLGKVNFVFAPNGSGKTTISKMLASQPVDAVARSSWQVAQTDLPIRVFNEKYREQVLTERVNGIFTMGEDSSTANEQIEALNIQKRARVRERDEWKTQIGDDKDESSRSGHLGSIATERGKARESVFDAYRDVDEDVAALIFKGFRNAREKFLTEALRRFANKPVVQKEVTWETLKSRALSLAGDKSLRQSLQRVSVSSIIAGSEIAGLKQSLISSGSGELVALIRRLAHEDWVSEGRQYLENSEGSCPFCQQRLDGGFELKLNDYFSNGFDDLLERAQEIRHEVSTRVSTLRNELSQLDQALTRDETIDAELFTKLISNVQAAVELVSLRVEEKCLHPTSAIEVEDVGEVLTELRAEVDRVNREVSEHNRLVKNAKQEGQLLIDDGWALFLSEKKVSAALKQFTGIIKKKDEAIQSLRSSIQTSKDADGNCDQEIAGLRKLVSNTGEVADRINKLLKSMGFHRFHVATDDMIIGGYRIVRADGSLAYESLSEGEKSFLCFVYFWESLFGASTSGEQPEDVVAVIDDPISSLDSDTLFIVAAHIRQAAAWAVDGTTNLRQLIVLTHNTQFHHEAAYEVDRSSKEKRHYYRLVKGMDGVTSVIDDENACRIRGSYPLLWDSVVEAAKNDDESALVRVGVFNIVRRIIEGYFKTIGKVADYQRPDGLAIFEERLVLMFHMWASSGSHTIADDIDQTMDTGGTKNFLRIFRRYFDLQGHAAHFDMMLRASGGIELAEQGNIFESTVYEGTK